MPRAPSPSPTCSRHSATLARRCAATALETAQHNFARAARLVQAGILPQKDSDQAASELAQAQVAAVTARRSQQLATLRAPLSGVVTRMSAVLGASVDPTQPLVEIADPGALDVVFSVSPAEAADMRDGDSVSLSAGETARGDPLGTGVVTGVAAGARVARPPPSPGSGAPAAAPR